MCLTPVELYDLIKHTRITEDRARELKKLPEKCNCGKLKVVWITGFPTIGNVMFHYCPECDDLVRDLLEDWKNEARKKTSEAKSKRNKRLSKQILSKKLR